MIKIKIWVRKTFKWFIFAKLSKYYFYARRYLTIAIIWDEKSYITHTNPYFVTPTLNKLKFRVFDFMTSAVCNGLIWADYMADLWILANEIDLF